MAQPKTDCCSERSYSKGAKGQKFTFCLCGEEERFRESDLVCWNPFLRMDISGHRDSPHEQSYRSPHFPAKAPMCFLNYELHLSIAFLNNVFRLHPESFHQE